MRRAAADHVEEQVGGDAVQPALEGAGLIVLHRPEHPDEGLLGQVLGVVLVAGQPVGQPVHPVGVLTHQFVPRRHGGHVAGRVEHRGALQLVGWLHPIGVAVLLEVGHAGRGHQCVVVGSSWSGLPIDARQIVIRGNVKMLRAIPGPASRRVPCALPSSIGVWWAYEQTELSLRKPSRPATLRNAVNRCDVSTLGGRVAGVPRTGRACVGRDGLALRCGHGHCR